MPGRRDPVERIFEGLLHTLARYGVQRTSMTDVSTETGISRGTLYRYFSTKDELLEGLAGYLVDDVRQNLAASVQARPDPERRIETALQELRMFVERRPSLEQIVIVEPTFVIDWYRSRFDELLATVTEVIAPAFNLEGGSSSEVGALAQLLLRLTLSFQLLPHVGTNGSTAQMAEVLDTYAEHRRRGLPAMNEG